MAHRAHSTERQPPSRAGTISSPCRTWQRGPVRPVHCQALQEDARPALGDHQALTCRQDRTKIRSPFCSVLRHQQLLQIERLRSKPAGIRQHRPTTPGFNPIKCMASDPAPRPSQPQSTQSRRAHRPGPRCAWRRWPPAAPCLSPGTHARPGAAPRAARPRRRAARARRCPAACRPCPARPGARRRRAWSAHAAARASGPVTSSR